MTPALVLHGHRLDLRRVQASDAVALFALADDPEVMRFLDWLRPASAEQTRKHLAEVDTRWNESKEFQWLVIERESARPVGTISARPAGHMADFGYFFGRDYWGRGYAAEAAGLVVEFLRAQSDIFRIWATADAENERSRRVLERVGLRLEGVMRRATVRPNVGGPPRDTVLYAWVRSSV